MPPTSQHVCGGRVLFYHLHTYQHEHTTGAGIAVTFPSPMQPADSNLVFVFVGFVNERTTSFPTIDSSKMSTDFLPITQSNFQQLTRSVKYNIKNVFTIRKLKQKLQQLANTLLQRNIYESVRIMRFKLRDFGG